MFESLYAIVYTSSITSEEYGTDFKMQPHSHSTLEIAYVQSGILEIKYENEKVGWRSCFFTAGQFALIKTGVKHYNVIHSERTRLMVAEFIPKTGEGDMLTLVRHFDSLRENKALKRIIDSKESVMVFTDTDRTLDGLKDLFFTLKSRRESIADELFELSYNTALRQLCLSVLRCKAFSPGAQGNVYVNKCLMFIKEYYVQDISLKTVAEYIGVSVSYIQRMFRQVYGKTIMSVVREERLNRAEYLLLHTDKTIKDIAMITGFKSANLMHKHFSSALHMSPAEFRKKNRNEEYFFIDTSFEKKFSE